MLCVPQITQVRNKRAGIGTRNTDLGDGVMTQLLIQCRLTQETRVYSPAPGWEISNCLSLQFQGIDSLGQLDTCTHILRQTYAHIYTLTNLQKVFLFKICLLVHLTQHQRVFPTDWHRVPSSLSWPIFSSVLKSTKWNCAIAL